MSGFFYTFLINTAHSVNGIILFVTGYNSVLVGLLETVFCCCKLSYICSLFLMCTFLFDPF